MKIEVISGKLTEAVFELGVFAAFEGDAKPSKLLPAYASGMKEMCATVEKSGFRGAANECILLPFKQKWALFVGLGKEKDMSVDQLRQFAATAAKKARSQGFRRFAIPAIYVKDSEDLEKSVAAVAEGILLGLYRYDRLKQVPKHEKSKRIDEAVILIEKSSELRRAKDALQKARMISEAVIFTRDLINGPSNIITPSYLASEAKKLARENKLKAKAIPFAQLKKLGFGGIVGVAQGSAHPAQFIIVECAPKRFKKTFVLCGKGITFDTGGISLKPAEKMEQMKYDMSGAAAVLGAIKAASNLKLPFRIIGLIAATENMPSGTAQKPGDVLKTLSGKTIEVINTDAEGRVVLADCLHYAKRYRPDCVIDLATLTGACVIALGSEAIGLFTKDEQLASRIQKAADATYERVWQLPMWDEYALLIKSDIADVKNTGGREAGATTAAKFLEEFAEGLKWAHLDIAGTAWTEKEKPYVPKGAVGIGVRLLIELMQQWK